MPLTHEKREEIVDKFGEHDQDHGSAEVQVALLTARIADLTEHFEENPQDHHSRQGLLNMVGLRRRLLDYLEENDVERYRWVLDELDLRR